MLYKTKKQIFHFIRIILFIIASVVFYTIMAHQNKLPALFEKYTGEIVREKTKSYYNEFFLEKSEVELVTEKERLKNKFFWDSIDYISREPGYIKASDILNSIASNIENLPKNKINNLLDLKSDPALVSWLSNQKGNFASLYRYEVIRKIDSYRYISSWAVLDENKKVIWSSKGYKASHIELEMEENNVSAAVDRFTIAVEKDKKIIGYMQGIWDIWKFPDLPFAGNQGSGIFGFIINHENKIISPSFIPAAYQRFTAENSTKYIGLYGGRMYPYRFITKTAGNINILLIYPSVSFAFYIFKVLLYFFILIAVLVFIRYIKKLRVLLKESGILSQKKWLEESLKQALTLNQNTVELAAQSQSLIHTIKQREQLTLAGLANKITMLPNMLAESIQPASQKSLKLLGEVILSGKELYEKPVKKSFTQLQEIPSLTESRFIHDDEEIKDKKIKITEMPDKVKDIEIEKRREDDKEEKIIIEQPEDEEYKIKEENIFLDKEPEEDSNIIIDEKIVFEDSIEKETDEELKKETTELKEETQKLKEEAEKIKTELKELKEESKKEKEKIEKDESILDLRKKLEELSKKIEEKDKIEIIDDDKKEKLDKEPEELVEQEETILEKKKKDEPLISIFNLAPHDLYTVKETRLEPKEPVVEEKAPAIDVDEEVKSEEISVSVVEEKAPAIDVDEEAKPEEVSVSVVEEKALAIDVDEEAKPEEVSVSVVEDKIPKEDIEPVPVEKTTEEKPEIPEDSGYTEKEIVDELSSKDLFEKNEEKTRKEKKEPGVVEEEIRLTEAEKSEYIEIKDNIPDSDIVPIKHAEEVDHIPSLEEITLTTLDKEPDEIKKKEKEKEDIKEITIEAKKIEEKEPAESYKEEEIKSSTFVDEKEKELLTEQKEISISEEKTEKKDDFQLIKRRKRRRKKKKKKITDVVNIKKEENLVENLAEKIYYKIENKIKTDFEDAKHKSEQKQKTYTDKKLKIKQKETEKEYPQEEDVIKEEIIKESHSVEESETLPKTAPKEPDKSEKEKSRYYHGREEIIPLFIADESEEHDSDTLEKNEKLKKAV